MELGVGGATRVAPPHPPDCSLEYLQIGWNQNRDNNRWAAANKIAVCALAPPTTGEPGSS